MKAKIENLKDLLVEQASDLYSAKKEQLKVLPKLKEQATSTLLKSNIERQIQEAKDHLKKLGEFFEEPGRAPMDGEGRCMKTLVQESVELAKRCRNENVRDASIITAIQHMNHYNIAGYGAVSTYAKELKYNDDASLLHDLLDREKKLDKTLSKIAMEKINMSAILAF